jgi:hypothetical protein
MTHVSVSIIRKKKQSGTFVPPDSVLEVNLRDGDFLFVRHDFERTDDGHGYKEGNPPVYGVPRQRLPYFEQKNQNGIPETQMLYGRDPKTGRIYDFTEWSESWQLRAFELLRWAIDNRLEMGEPYEYVRRVNGKLVKTTESDPYARVRYKPYLSDATRDYIPVSLLGIWEDSYSDSVALNDNHAFDDGLADYVQRRNLNAKPMQLKSLLMGGLPVMKLGVDGQYTVIDALDPLQPAPPLDWILRNKKHCIGWGTAADVLNADGSLARLSDGRWKVSMWGKFKAACRMLGIANVGFPYFIFGRGGTNLVPTVRLIRKQIGRYSPYVP